MNIITLGIGGGGTMTGFILSGLDASAAVVTYTLPFTVTFTEVNRYTVTMVEADQS